MNKKRFKKLIILLFLVLITTTGCTKILVDKNKKPVADKVTGQKLTKNIFCQPSNNITKETYKQNGVEIDKLDECKNFKVNSGKYEGLWESFFVKPLAWIIIKIGIVVKNYGLGLILTTIFIKLILMPLSQKSNEQSEKMQVIQPELKRIEEKYKDKTEKDSLMKKSQEMSMIYQKHKINPVSSCLVAFIQLPLLFAFLEAINRVPAIFEATFLGFQLGTSPFVGIKNGSYIYIILVLLNALGTYFTFKTNSAINKTNEQSKMMVISMTVTISVMSIFMPAALNLYWIANSLLSILQIVISRKIKKGTKK